MRLSGDLSQADQVALERVLDVAFAPDRAVTTRVAPARVRARLAWERPTEREHGWRAVALLDRVSHGALAAGVTALLCLSTVTTTVPAPAPAPQPAHIAHVSAPLEDSRFLRWIRIGRAAHLYVDPAATAPSAPSDGSDDLPTGERQGLRR